LRKYRLVIHLKDGTDLFDTITEKQFRINDLYNNLVKEDWIITHQHAVRVKDIKRLSIEKILFIGGESKWNKEILLQ